VGERGAVTGGSGEGWPGPRTHPREHGPIERLIPVKVGKRSMRKRVSMFAAVEMKVR